jgi:hypothetical protein
MWRLYQLWKRWGVSPLELLEWPMWLVEGFQTCELVERKMNLPVGGGDAS